MTLAGARADYFHPAKISVAVFDKVARGFEKCLLY